MKTKTNCSFFFLLLLLCSLSFFLKAQNKSKNDTKNDIFYQRKINQFWQNNQTDSTLLFYQTYLSTLNQKKETQKYITFQIRRLKIAYLVGDAEVIESSIQELQLLKLNQKKEIDLIHQITFQEAKYEHWKGFYQKAVDLFKKIPNYEALKSYQLANRYANVSTINLDFFKEEKFEDTKFETSYEQTELLSQLFALYGMSKDALLLAEKSIDYLPKNFNALERIDLQIYYANLLDYQSESKKIQAVIDKAERQINNYAQGTELQLRWEILYMNNLLDKKQLRLVKSVSDSIWKVGQNSLITSPVFLQHINLRSSVLSENRNWEENDILLNKYIQVFTNLYPSNLYKVQVLQAHKAVSYFYADFYQNSVDFVTKIIEQPIASEILKNEMYKLNAIAYSRLKNYDKTLFYAEKYLEYVQRTFGKEDIKMTAMYYVLCILSRDKGNYQEAIEYAKRSIEIYETQNTGEHSLSVVTFHQAITNVYLKMEQPQKALFHSLEAKNILEPICLKTRFYAMAQTYTNLAINYRSLENYDSAYYYYHLSLAAEQSLPEEKQKKASIGRIYNNMGYAFEKQQNYDSAIFYYNKSIKEKEKSEQSWNTSNVLNNLANCFVAISEVEEAEYHYKKSLERNILGKDYADLEVALESYKRLGNLDKFSFTQRLKFYRKADEIIDKIRSQVHTDNDQLVINKVTTEVYGKALSTCFEATEMKNVKEQIYEDAFYFAEKNRAYLLRKQTQETLVLAQVPEELRKTDANYSSLLDYYQREILEIENSNQSDKLETQNIKLAYYNQQILETRTKHQELKRKLSSDYKSYKSLQEPTPLSTTKTIKENLKDNEQLLVYQWFEPYLFVQVITKTKQLFYRIKPVNFEENVKEYRNCLAKDCSAEKFVIQSNVLYNILIHPIEQSIQKSRKLVIIPDAILQQIPFSTLVNISKDNLSYQNITYPLLNYQISFHYSSSLWCSEREKKARNQIQKLATNYEYEFIGFAPAFEENKENNNLILASNRNNLNPLPYSKQEIEEVANLFINQNKKALAFTNLQANKENLKNYATKTRRLHLATHSQTFTKTPFNSHIWFFGKDSIQDNKEIMQRVYASDLYGMSFPNELVVLSSCRSGVGQVVEGEGVITLTRSFLNAGTENVIFSLWQIDDLATKELMTLFYVFVSQGKSYSESLQLAKQSLSKSEKFKNPFYWAGILLVGE